MLQFQRFRSIRQPPCLIAKSDASHVRFLFNGHCKTKLPFAGESKGSFGGGWLVALLPSFDTQSTASILKIFFHLTETYQAHCSRSSYFWQANQIRNVTAANINPPHNQSRFFQFREMNPIPKQITEASQRKVSTPINLS